MSAAVCTEAINLSAKAPHPFWCGFSELSAGRASRVQAHRIRQRQEQKLQGVGSSESGIYA